ncbi:MAG: aldo/keto reductase [Planctomycetaceae bacterium]
MRTRRFGKTGRDVSDIGFGAAPIGLLETEQRQVANILDALLAEGVDLIDTAAGYRGSEEAIGKAVGHRRDEFTLVTKCGTSGAAADDEAWTPAAIAESVDRSLRRLRTDVLDVVLLHSCPIEVLERGDSLQALVAARDAGKIRFAGFSGDNQTARYAATLPDVAVIETSVNICDQANIDAVLPAARKHDVGVIAKRPIANAAWKGRSRQPGFYADYADPYAARLERMRVTPADLGFDADPDEAWPEIAIRFVLSFPDVHTAIIGTTNAAHAKKNLAAAAKGPLPPNAVERLRAAFRQAEADAGETWKGLT